MNATPDTNADGETDIDRAYRCAYHQEADQSEYYKCEDCQLNGVLEPDDIDKQGKRYPRYDEWLDAS